MAHGIGQSQIVLDPGIGFGKLLVHNLTLLAQLHSLRAVLAARCWWVSHERRSLGSWWTVRFRSVMGYGGGGGDGGGSWSSNPSCP